jgi:PGF-CTERM protein
MATRRTFLIGAAAATTGLAGAAGSATAQAQTFELELTEDGFVGRSGDISGTTNPTLEMEAGNEYAINASFTYFPEMEGLPARHNLAIRSESGTPYRSDYVFPDDDDPESPETEQSVSATIEATSDLTAYLCEEHMGEGGDISVSGGATATPTPTESDMDDGDGGDMDDGDGGDGGDMDGGDGGDGGGETNGGGPGFGVGAAVTALGAATYGALRKRDSDE